MAIVQSEPVVVHKWCGTPVQVIVVSQGTLYCPTCRRLVDGPQVDRRDPQTGASR